jgi:hypothetical protein
MKSPWVTGLIFAVIAWSLIELILSAPSANKPGP